MSTAAINTKSAPPPVVQPPVTPAPIQTAKVENTSAAAAQGPRDPTPAPQAKPLELATSGSLGTKINTSA